MPKTPHSHQPNPTQPNTTQHNVLRGSEVNHDARDGGTERDEVDRRDEVGSFRCSFQYRVYSLPIFNLYISNW